ncbi:MAG: transglycosylase domain-containing protein [Bacteroidales bacterium]|nr:transglycosylase domain-containing protein [Bacteroidales bacterium]
MTENKSSYSKYVRWFWALFAFPFVLVTAIFILINLEVFGPMPGFEELENPDNDLAAEVYSDDGVLLGKFYLQNRTWTEYEDISPYLIAALISTEDIRFHRHSGIDVRALARVAVKSVLMRQGAGGGSTITQQLAKNLYDTREKMTGESSPTGIFSLIIAKFKEWSTAVRLERNYTKEEIITMYLNVYDFLYNAVGVRSASEVYFNSFPDSLKIEEAATLVGMLKNSALYNPVRNPEGMMNRRNIVLSQMARYGYIKGEVADSLMQLPIEIDFREQSHDTGLATYLREYIRLTMIKYEPERRNFLFEADYEDARKEWDNNPLYGWCRKNLKPDGNNYNLYRDGLKIHTTIDSRMQKYAEEAVAEHLGENLQETFNSQVRNNSRPPYSNDISAEEFRSIMDASVKRTDRYRVLRQAGMPEDSIRLIFNTEIPMKLFSYNGEIDTIMSPYDSVLYYKYIVRSSMMAMDPHNGYVKAYVGGPDFRYFKYDAVTQQRKQVGSTIKPFLYTLAIQDGYSPCYEVENIPRQFDVGDSTWSPRSSGPREYHGRMVTLRWGLAQSENYISAWLMKQFSPSAVVDLMGRMGINTRYVEAVPSIFLGTGIITVKEMVGAFGTFANKGVYIDPTVVSRIEDRNGNVISRFIPAIEEVMSDDHAYLMLDLLQGVTNRGTGVRMRFTYNLYNQLGGKTGTTQNHSNGWYMSVAPNLVGGVWTGWEDQSIHFENLSLGQGANMALPVYGLFLQKLYADPELGIMELDEFEMPPGFNMELDCDKLKSESAGRDRYRIERF